MYTSIPKANGLNNRQESDYRFWRNETRSHFKTRKPGSETLELSKPKSLIFNKQLGFHEENRRRHFMIIPDVPQMFWAPLVGGEPRA